MQSPFSLLCVVVLLTACANAQDPEWDHQNVTYAPQFKPLIVSEAAYMYVKPYFSPDHSLDTQLEIIEAATESIDIGTPSYGPWVYCDSTTDDDDGFSNGTCQGCAPSVTRSDPFPLFGALLNAAHRGVKIRLITNDYGVPDCLGSISALPFFQFNSIQVKYYSSTTFIHAKYMAVDGKIVSISSVNYSKTSYMSNREAGVIFQGQSNEIVEFTTSVFEADWAVGIPLVISQTYNATDMSVILDTSKIAIVMPPSFNNSKAYITPTPKAIELDKDTPVKVYASPDFARDQVLYDLGNVTTSLAIMIYQVTDMDFCTSLYNLHAAGKNVTLVVSYRIYGAADCALALTCYNYLYNKGMVIHKTPSYYDMSHNKFWIIDGVRVAWSTGNWSPSDYPAGSDFPPFGQPGWQSVNRDFTGEIEHPDVVSVFQTVLNEDTARGYTFTPSYPVQCGY